MTIEIIKIDEKIFEINYDILDPNGNPVIVELQDQDTLEDIQAKYMLLSYIIEHCQQQNFNALKGRYGG